MVFDGFPVEAFTFYQRLEADNSREFWQAHRSDYERCVLAPVRALAAELEPEFGPLAVYRPQRDTRFSADKSPYKAYQGAFAQRVPGLGFYLQISATGMQASGGYHSHSSDQVARYRQAVDANESGSRLAHIVTSLAADGLTIGGDRLKTMPRGVPADHPRADLMRYRSLTASRDWPVGPLLHSQRAFGLIQQTWRQLVPLCDWLGDHVGQLLVSLRLDLVQLGVMAAASHKLVMAADLRHVSVIEYDDDVSHPDRAESVRHQDRDASVAGAVAGPASVLLEEFVLGFGVERSGRFIKRHDQGLVTHETAG